MSYDIVYAREFIKTADKRIIPLVLGGSNNCWEQTFTGRYRRDRNWSNMLVGVNSKIAFEEDELMMLVNKYVPSNYQQHFMKNNKWVDDAGFVRFFKNGIKKAKTLEEIKTEVRSMSALCGTVVNYAGDKNKKMLMDVSVTNSDELDIFLKMSERIISDRQDEDKIYVRLEFTSDNPLERHKEKRTKKVRKENDYYVVKYNSNYIYKLTRNKIGYVGYASVAKQFSSRKEADKWIVQHNLRARFINGELTVEYVA